MKKPVRRGPPDSILAVIPATILLIFIASGIARSQSPAETAIFEETFEDTLFSSRGWYDFSAPMVTTSSQHVEGSTRSCEFRWTGTERTTPVHKGARARIEPVEGLTLTFHVKFSDNWKWTGVGYHPHFIMFTTNVDGETVGPASTHLTMYVEPVDGKLLFGVQDAQNIDLQRLGQNLVGITENRAIAGGNGDSDGYGGTAYLVDQGVYRNGKQMTSDSILFSDSRGPLYKGDWHHVKAHIQLNSIIDGKGVANGVVRYWFDGELVLDLNDVMMRTGKHPNMKINQFLLLPYFGPGLLSQDQTLWIDDIRIFREENELPAVDPPVYNPVLIDENFEDSGFEGRGWYDSPTTALDPVTYTEGTGSSARFTWTAGMTSPATRGGRIQFDPVEGFSMSFYLRLGENWEWPADTSQSQSLFWIVTDRDDRFTNPLNTFLTAQIAPVNGKLKLRLSDYRNINLAHLGENLTDVTENRAVCGGNGDSDAHGGTYSEQSPGVVINSKTLSTPGTVFTDNPGPFYKNEWRHVRVRLQLNSIVNGKGVANGVAQFWLDGKQVVDHRNVMFRTGQHPEMKFNQLMLLPYIGGGAPNEQSLWIDDLRLVKDEQELRIPVPLDPDVNGDGKVGLTDVLAFILKGNKTPEAPELDLNNDGVYDFRDVIEMLRRVIARK